MVEVERSVLGVFGIQNFEEGRGWIGGGIAPVEKSIAHIRLRYVGKRSVFRV